MTHARRFLFRMGIFLGVVLMAIAVLFDGLVHAFNNNVGLNSLILGILLVGIGLNIRQVILLGQDAGWLEEFRQGREPRAVSTRGPRLLAPLAGMLGERRDRLSLSPAALRSLLDGIASRLEESREIARYFTGLMIFLGLLGTFWGLSQTVGSVSYTHLTLPTNREV